MPKLVRLLGDSEKSSTEVRNSFRQPLIIKPNSKVALVGVSVVLNDEVVNEEFIINDQNNGFRIGEIVQATDYLENATITPGSYTAYELVDEFVVAANYTGSGTYEQGDIGLGLHNIGDFRNNKLYLTTHKAEYGLVDFAGTITPSQDKWDIINGSTSVFTEGAVTASGPLDLLSNIDYSSVPMVANIFSATLTNPNSVNMEIEAISLGFTEKVRWGLRVIGGQYYEVVNDVSASLSVAAQAGDEVILNTYAGTFSLQIDSSAGSNKYLSIDSGVISRELYDARRRIVWHIGLGNGGGMTDCRSTTLYDAPSTDKTDYKDLEVEMGLQFTNAAGGTNSTLAKFLGFGTAGNTIIKYGGYPATLESRDNVSGFSSYPGILVTLDGLGPFESFDGAATSRAPDNILYVLNDLKTISVNTLQLDIPAPFYLNLNNANPVNVNELRVRFLPAAGQTSNPVLSFSGKPSITLLID